METEIERTPENQPEPKAKQTPYGTTTLQELGPILPVLRRNPQTKEFTKDREFSFIDWDMETEERVAALKKDANSVGHFVNKMMCLLLDRFCGQDMQSMDENAKTVMMSQLEFPNLMYMYIWLRVEELGEQYNVGDITCPVCRKVNKDFMGDLNTLEVRTKDENNEREVDYELKRPITLNDQVITNLKLDVSKWEVLEKANVEDAENDGKMKFLMLKSAINGASTAEGPIEGYVDTDQLLRKLKKVDIEKSMKAVTDNNAGPVMGVSGTCIHCKAEFMRQLDWRYDHFFDSSSL